MDIFNIDLPPEGDNKFKDLNTWFDFMNDHFKSIAEKSKVNDLLNDNNIKPIK